LKTSPDVHRKLRLKLVAKFFPNNQFHENTICDAFVTHETSPENDMHSQMLALVKNNAIGTFLLVITDGDAHSNFM